MSELERLDVRPVPLSEGLISYGEARRRIDPAIDDTVEAVRRQIGLVRGAGSIPEPWIRMIASDAARLTLGMQINPDRPEVERVPCLVIDEVEGECEEIVVASLALSSGGEEGERG